MTSAIPPPSWNEAGGAEEAFAFSLDQLRRELTWQASHDGTWCAAVETEAQFWRLAPLWRALQDSDPASSPFACWEWAWNWWQYFGKHPRDGASASRLLVVVVLTESHELIGLFPFHFPVYPASSKLGRAAAARPLRAFGSLGRHREALSEEPILLTKPDALRRALEGALHFLLRQQPLFAWDLIDCWVQHSEEALLSVPRSSCSAWQARFQHRRVSPVMAIALPPSWEAMRGSLSKSLRDNLRYYPRLLARHGHVWEVSLVATQEEVAQEVAGLVALHRRREEMRAEQKEGGHLPSEAHRRFLHDVLPALARRGAASVAVLRIDGQPAAAQALLRQGEKCLFYYSGFDPAWSAYSPLTILQAEVFAFLCHQQVTAVGLLAGEAPWKARWGAQRVGTLQQLSYVRSRPASFARMLLYAYQKKTARDTVEPAED